MAERLVWTDEALEDIDGLAEYISRDSAYYARKVAQDILGLHDSILNNPLIGRVVPELGNEQIRERFIYSYRVIYEIYTTDVHVLAVLHGKRLLAAVEDRFGTP